MTDVAEPVSEIAESSPAKLDLKIIAGLIWRTWPYYKPQLKHLITYMCLNAAMGAVMVSAGFIAMDLFNNKILVGEPVQPLQATLLFLDDSYVRKGAAAKRTEAEGSEAKGTETKGAEDTDAEATGAEKELLSDHQRRVVRNRLFVWIGVWYMVLMAMIAGVGYYMTWIYQRINQHLRVTMLERAENLSLKYHSHARTGDIIYRVYQDSATITNVAQQLIITPLRAASWLLFGIVVLTFFSPWLGLMCLVTAVPISALFAWFTPRIQARSRLARATNSDLTSRIQEVFSAIKIVKANRAEATVLDRFNQDSKQALDAAFYLRVEIVLLGTGVALLATGAVLLCEYLMAGWTIEEKATYLGAMVAFVGFAVWNLGAYQSGAGTTGQTARQSHDLVELWGVAQDLAVGLDRAFFLLDLEPGVVQAVHPEDFPTPIRQVTWRNINFSFEQDRPVLNGVHLTASAGTITAIVGATGVGKSTLMSLLLRLYDPDEGNVFVNDTNLKDLSLTDLRSNVAIALQQNVLFATTVAENIAYATRGATRSAIETAARVACADTFIQEMPAGYDTELGERGGKLSTGQRQRLSIARAILRDTPILILDEPTASLDAQTEHQVLENLSEWSRQRVVFLITHRLSTIRNADQIAFMKDGKVVEFGSHDELMSLDDGHYRGFVEAELVGSTDETSDAT